MQISFYKISDPPEKMNKTLGTALTLTGTVRGELDKTNPNILVSSDIGDKNYMYIPEFGRYYYLNGCSIVRTGLWELKNVHCDALMSFRSQILANRVIIDKTESTTLKNEYINDGSVVITEKTTEEKLPFGSGFNESDYRYVLITAGRDANITGL